MATSPVGRRLRRGAASVVLGLAALVAPAATAHGGACAGAADGPHAALVVDTGSSVVAYCVALDAASVSGTHLIELAGEQHGLDYAFGFGGGAVCRLAGVGVDGGDCFGAFPDFWGYWHGDGLGGWAWAPTGAAGHGVADGAVEGWSWGSGDSPETHATPPATTIADVCGAPDVPSPPPGGGGGGGTGGGDGGGAGGGGPGDGGGSGGGGSQPGGAGGGGAPGTTPGSSPSVDDPATGPTGVPPTGPTGDAAGGAGGAGGATGVGGATAAPTGSGEDEVRAAAADDAPGSVPVPPVAGAIAVIAALALGGWWRMRRRPGGP